MSDAKILLGIGCAIVGLPLLWSFAMDQAKPVLREKAVEIVVSNVSDSIDERIDDPELNAAAKQATRDIAKDLAEGKSWDEASADIEADIEEKFNERAEASELESWNEDAASQDDY